MRVAALTNIRPLLWTAASPTLAGRTCIYTILVLMQAALLFEAISTFKRNLMYIGSFEASAPVEYFILQLLGIFRPRHSSQFAAAGIFIDGFVVGIVFILLRSRSSSEPFEA